MKQTFKQFPPTELTKAFDQFNTFLYLSGMKGFWINKVKLPKTFVKVFDKVLIMTDKLSLFLMITYVAAYYTQDNLTPEQSFDLLLFIVALPVVNYYFYVFLYYRADVRDIFYHLVVVLKEHYYNEEEQLLMVKKIKLLIGVLTISLLCMFIERAVSCLVNTILYGDVFYPYVGVWPDVNYTSKLGLIGAIINYMLVWAISIRTVVVYAMAAVILMIHTYQFKDLQNYFYKLDEIFKDNTLCQAEKEEKYENGFKTGIYMHCVSLWCVRKCQHVCRTIFSVQLLLTVSTLIMSMIVVISGDLAAKLAQAPLVGVLLTNLAIFMWNAGDITFEAERVANAMYASGWQNCYGKSSVRVKKLVVNAMAVAQKPLVLRAFGVVEMSYESFTVIIKASYSLLSVFS